MKYRKKPVVIEAVRFIGWNKLGVSYEKAVDECPTWLKKAFDSKVVVFKPEKSVVCIKTLEGAMEANIGDYIIKSVNGEIYPCKPNIFKTTYEEV